MLSSIHTSMEDLAKSIKNIRLKQNLSQKRFGHKIGISGKTISAYERGKCIPPLKVLEKISQAYEISVIDLTKNNENLLINRIKRLQIELNEISRLLEI